MSSFQVVATSAPILLTPDMSGGFRDRQDDHVALHESPDSEADCSTVRGCGAGSRDVTGGCVSGVGAAHGWAATSPLSREVRQ